jgi:hypothetical protein
MAPIVQAITGGNGNMSIVRVVRLPCRRGFKSPQN